MQEWVLGWGLCGRSWLQWLWPATQAEGHSGPHMQCPRPHQRRSSMQMYSAAVQGWSYSAFPSGGLGWCLHCTSWEAVQPLF